MKVPCRPYPASSAVNRRLWVCALAALALWSGAARAQTMTFVMDPFPPFTYEENGVPAGPMSETILAACGLLKLRCKLESYPWRRALRMAEDGHVDGIYALANIPERQQHFYMMPPTIESAYAVFVHRSSTLKYTAPQDLEGHTVGVYGPSAASKALETLALSAPTLHMVMEIDNPTLLRKLSGMRYGEQGAALANMDVGAHLIRSEHIPDLKIAGKVGRIEYCIGLSRQKVTTKQAEEFAAALRQLIKTGKVREIARKHGVAAP